MSRVLIADEHPITRHAVRLLLEEERHTIIGEAVDGLEALGMVTSLRPDLLIIDVDLSRVTGLDVIRRLRARGITQPILGFSTQDSEHLVSRFLQAGASGFVSKHQQSEVLKEAVAVLLRGQTYFPSTMLGSVHKGNLKENDAERIAALSNRELSVLGLLASGHSNQEIASELTISEKSVSTYRARMRVKLNLHSMIELIDFARRNRLASSTKLLAAPTNETDAQSSMWRSMVESLPGAFYVRDTQARLLYANPAHLQMYNANLESVLGTRTTEVDWYTPKDATNMLVFLQREIAEQRSFDKDIELNIHGDRRVLHHWGTPYRDQEGNLLGMICCSTDITQRYEQLDGLRVRAEKAELAQQQLTELLASISQQLGDGLTSLADTLVAEDAAQVAARLQVQQLQQHLNCLHDALTQPSDDDAQIGPIDIAEVLAVVTGKLRTSADTKRLKQYIEVNEPSHLSVTVHRKRLFDLLLHLGRYVIDLTCDGEVRWKVVATVKDMNLGARLSIEGIPLNNVQARRSYSLSELTHESDAAGAKRNSLDLNIARHLALQLGAELHITRGAENSVTTTLHLLLPLAPRT
ncbi:response regulator [Pseudomonas sp.]|jgi:PAS domain S-box-containing protein|uniref:response regulator n=2 Tax=Pseudomonas sp. TaxID=306 RepID=UPI002FCC4FF8